MWSNKQRLVSQLWKKAWCDPEGLDVLRHAVWLFLLIRKPKTILKEPSWCCHYQRRNRDTYMSRQSQGVSSLCAKPLSALLLELYHTPLKKSGVESHEARLWKRSMQSERGTTVNITHSSATQSPCTNLSGLLLKWIEVNGRMVIIFHSL